MQILRAADRRPRPWKNGGGVTHEILVSPPEADLSAFDWRISMATVAEDGPFSVFPGIDRALAIVEGAGFRLRIGAEPEIVLSAERPPILFAADVPTQAALINGETLDLNLMVQRNRFRPSIRREILAASRLFSAQAPVTLLLVGGAAATEDYPLLPFDAVWLEPGEALRLSPAPDAVAVYVLEIWYAIQARTDCSD